MTPAQIDQILNTIYAEADICGTLRELLDIMAENPTLFATQIARACGYLHEMECPAHPLCGSES